MSIAAGQEFTVVTRRIAVGLALTLLLTSGGVLRGAPAQSQPVGAHHTLSIISAADARSGTWIPDVRTRCRRRSAPIVMRPCRADSGSAAADRRSRGQAPISFYRFDIEDDGVVLAAPADYVAIVSRTGRLLASRTRGLPVSVDGTQPTSVSLDAVNAAMTHARDVLAQSGPLTATDPALEIWVDKDGRGRLGWLTIVRESAGFAASTAYRIAAIGSPEIMSAVNLRQFQSTIHVQSNVWQLSPNLPTVVVPLSDARVSSDAGTILTNQNGDAMFPSLVPGGAAFAQLRGPFAVTTNEQGPPLLGTVTTTGATTTLDFGADTESELAQTTAFRAATLANRWVRSYIPSLNARTSNLDELIVSTNNSGLECNTFTAGGLIVFGRSGAGCNNTATTTIVAHEFGHEVHLAFAQDAFDASYSEGFGDALSTLFTEQPCLGPGFLVSSENCLRDASDVTNFPVGSSDPHERGQPYAQFAWTLATTLGIDRAAQLVLGAAAAAPIDIPDAVYLSFVVDDDDGLLGTCSPNQVALEDAADSRLLPRPPDCRPAGDNRAPTALDDAFSLIEDAPATALNLTANDTDPDGDALVVTNIHQGSLGVVACSALGCTYTPNPMRTVSTRSDTQSSIPMVARPARRHASLLRRSTTRRRLQDRAVWLATRTTSFH